MTRASIQILTASPLRASFGLFAMWSVSRKRKVLAGFVLLALLCIGWIWMRSLSEPEVIGNISPADLAEIKSIVQREIWRGTLPDYRWNSIKQLPGKVYEHASVHISFIQTCEKRQGDIMAVLVMIRDSKKRSFVGGGSGFTLYKTQKGWEVEQTEFL